MFVIENPALKAFVAQLPDELVFAQVLIRRHTTTYELRHLADAASPIESLLSIEIPAVRPLAQTTAIGEFRPLKSAPTLGTGWRILAKNDAELDTILSHLYPGALADWYAAQSSAPPITHYRTYADRQSGMYRITAMLSDASVAQVIQATCPPTLCLKQRLWTVPGFPPDAAAAKSLIPCLEPCAVFMESARRALRAEQQEKAEPTNLAIDPKAG